MKRLEQHMYICFLATITVFPEYAEMRVLSELTTKKNTNKYSHMTTVGGEYKFEKRLVYCNFSLLQMMSFNMKMSSCERERMAYSG